MINRQESVLLQKDHHLIDIIPQLFWIHNDLCKYINLPLRQYVGGMDLSADSFNLVEYIHPEDVPALDEFLHQPIIAELTFEKPAVFVIIRASIIGS
jgi:hypothetical protein